MPYALAVALVAGAFAATAFLKLMWIAPSFMFFVPAVAIAAWHGGRGPTLLATTLSLFLIDFYFVPPAGSLKIGGETYMLDVVAFLVLAATLVAAMEGLRRARRVAESRATELERVAARASKLLEVTTALSEARTVEDVTAVVLGKGLTAVQAVRGTLVYAEGEQAKVLGARGYDAVLVPLVHALTRDSDVPVMHALRTGTPIWLASAEAVRRLYPWAFARLGAVSESQTFVALPLLHLDETVGALALTFDGPFAFGAADRTFTLLLAQATAAAIHRASSYDSEREMRRQAELLARVRADVLGIVAHDLRNPLSLIGMTTQFLLEQNPSESKRVQLFDMIVRATKQMNRLIADLLDTVRLQAGRLSLDVEDVSTDAILLQAEETFRPIAESRHIHLVIAQPDDAIMVRADAVRVAQVLGNLLGNALKFTPEQGAVTLRVLSDDSSVVFQVSDTGPGIAAADLPHLFEDFWQARNDRRGAGLGLAIVKGLVEAHGGTIGVTSTVGAGSTFSVSLPVAATQWNRKLLRGREEAATVP